MTITLRRGTAADAGACGTICYEAFRSICEAHNFPPDFPSVEAAGTTMAMMLAHPGVYSVVAELDGKVVGSNFLAEQGSIAGVGPISVGPKVQNRGIGARLMEDVLARAAQQKAAGVGSCRRVSITDHCASIRGWASPPVSRCRSCKAGRLA